MRMNMKNVDERKTENAEKRRRIKIESCIESFTYSFFKSPILKFLLLLCKV